MNNLLHTFAEYPLLIGITLFLAISLALALLLGILMRRAAMSLKPLIFFFGFLGIIAVPQMSVHLLDAFVHARQTDEQPAEAAAVTAASIAPSALQPVPWDIVFGPNADPSLITDAKHGLDSIVSDASEAKIAFNAAGESALAARFANAKTAATALNRYGSFSDLPRSPGMTQVDGPLAASTARVNGIMSLRPGMSCTPGAAAPGKASKLIASARLDRCKRRLTHAVPAVHPSPTRRPRRKPRLVSPRIGAQ